MAVEAIMIIFLMISGLVLLILNEGAVQLPHSLIIVIHLEFKVYFLFVAAALQNQLKNLNSEQVERA